MKHQYNRWNCFYLLTAPPRGHTHTQRKREKTDSREKLRDTSGTLNMTERNRKNTRQRDTHIHARRVRESRAARASEGERTENESLKERNAQLTMERERKNTSE